MSQPYQGYPQGQYPQGQQPQQQQQYQPQQPGYTQPAQPSAPPAEPKPQVVVATKTDLSKERLIFIVCLGLAALLQIFLNSYIRTFNNSAASLAYYDKDVGAPLPPKPPLEPVNTYVDTGDDDDDKEKDKAKEAFEKEQEAFSKDMKEYKKSSDYKTYLKDMSAWNKEKHDATYDLAKTKRRVASAGSTIPRYEMWFSFLQGIAVLGMLFALGKMLKAGSDVERAGALMAAVLIVWAVVFSEHSFIGRLNL